MKKILYIILFISNFLVLSHANQKHFKVSYDPDYAPFSYLENNKAEGLLIDYWKLWAEKNNYSLEFVNGKLWKDAIKLVEDEKVDFFLGTFPYEQWMKSSISFYNTQSSLFIHKNNSKGFSKKAAYIIGIIGDDYKSRIKHEFPNSQIIVYKDYPSVFKDFISRKVDLIYDDKIAIEFYALRNNYFHQIRSIELVKNPHDFKAIAKKDELIDIFNKGFKKITNEELYEIESKWIINENQQIYKSKNIYFSKEEIEFIKNNKIKVLALKKWYPFSFENKNEIQTGVLNDLWQVITKKTSLKTQNSFFDKFQDIEKSINEKTHDLSFSVVEKENLNKHSTLSKTFLSLPISIVTLKDENFIENMTYLFNKRIAVNRNSYIYKILKNNYPNLSFMLVSSAKEGLNAVNNQEAYSFIDIKSTLSYNIKKYNFEELKISGNTGLNYEFKMLIRKDYLILESIINKAISKLSHEDISSVLNKWNNVQFENTFDYKKLWVALIVIASIFIILIYINQINIKRNKKLKNIVDNKTKELKKLNQELEKRVYDKTKELKRTNYILDEAQKITHLGSFQYNLKKKELFWSDELYKIFGLYPQDIHPTIETLISYVHKDDKKFVKKRLSKIKYNNKKSDMEFKILLNDGSIKYLQFTAKVTRFNEKDKPLLIIGTILDLTKIKKLEMEKHEKESILAQQSKMAAMGEMLENIAHQWRQPLSVISTASTGMQLQLQINQKIENDELLKTVQSINKHTQYLSKTIDDFRNFFNPNKTNVEFDIEDSIEKSLYLVNTRLSRNNIIVKKKITNHKVYALENELIQVLLNILNNGLDALESSKNVKSYIFISTSINNDKLQISIKDNAGGIPKKIINRIFEPYFTTKHKSQGTGIGLYMSNEIITKHLHGNLKVKNSTYNIENITYKGAEFIISMPIA